MKLKVEGMSCGGCVKSVTNIVKDMDPGAEVVVTLETGLVEVTSSSLAPAAVAEALDDGGFPATPAES